MCKLIGFSCSFVASKFNSKMQAIFCGRIFPSLYSFFVVMSSAKTECYSPSNLLVRSATYRTSATYQLSTCRKWYVASLQAFHKHHTSTVTCSESKLRNPPGQNDGSRQKLTTRWKYFFVSSYWGMSTLDGWMVRFSACLDWWMDRCILG